MLAPWDGYSHARLEQRRRRLAMRIKPSALRELTRVAHRFVAAEIFRNVGDETCAAWSVFSSANRPGVSVSSGGRVCFWICGDI